MKLVKSEQEFELFTFTYVGPADTCEAPSEYPCYIYPTVNSWVDQTFVFNILDLIDLEVMTENIKEGRV